MVVFRVFEPVLLRVEPPLRLVVLLRAVELPEERFVVEPLRARLLAVRLPPERLVLRLDAVRLRVEAARPVVRRVVEPLRDAVVLRAVVFRAAGLRAVVFRAVVVLRAVVFRAAGLRAVVFRAVVVLRAVVFRAVVFRAVAFPPLRPAAFCCAVERFDVDELRDVFDAPLVFRPVVLVRANALRLLSLKYPTAE